jgi:hypothetical protein
LVLLLHFIWYPNQKRKRRAKKLQNLLSLRDQESLERGELGEVLNLGLHFAWWKCRRVEKGRSKSRQCLRMTRGMGKYGRTRPGHCPLPSWAVGREGESVSQLLACPRMRGPTQCLKAEAFVFYLV